MKVVVSSVFVMLAVKIFSTNCVAQNESWEFQAKCALGNKLVRVICFDTTNELIAATSIDGTISILKGNKLLVHRSIDAKSTNNIRTYFFDNSTKLIGANQTFSQVWEISTGKLLQQFAGVNPALSKDEKRVHTIVNHEFGFHENRSYDLDTGARIPVYKNFVDLMVHHQESQSKFSIVRYIGNEYLLENDTGRLLLGTTELQEEREQSNLRVAPNGKFRFQSTQPTISDYLDDVPSRSFDTPNAELGNGEVIDTATDQSIAVFSCSSLGIVFSPNSELFAYVHDQRNELCIHNIANEGTSFVIELGELDAPTCISWSKDCKSLAIGTQSGEVVLWTKRSK